MTITIAMTIRMSTTIRHNNNTNNINNNNINNKDNNIDNKNQNSNENNNSVHSLCVFIALALVPRSYCLVGFQNTGCVARCGPGRGSRSRLVPDFVGGSDIPGRMNGGLLGVLLLY